MSGAEAALLGVGILCNAMQIMTFAKDSIHVYRNIRDGRAPDPKLDSYLKNVKASFDEMNQTAAQMGPLGQTQQQIFDVGKKVHDCVDELQQQFAKLHVDETSKRGLLGKMAASRKSAAALWRGKELQDAEKNLQRHEQLLHSLLLDRVCSQFQAAEITSLTSFQHLQGALQSIISQLVEGSTKVSDLVTDFSSNMSDRLVEEHATTRTAIEEHVTSAENTIRQNISQSINQLRQELLQREQDKAFEKQHEQLLSSLRFPEMNGRKNHISDNYPGTFGWIFDRHRSLHLSRGSSSEPGHDGQVYEDTQASEMDGRRCPKCVETTKRPGFDCFAGWLESDSSLFWISGKPASGKSSLVKFLAFNNLTVDHLRSWRSNVQILTHFFWKPGQLLQQNVEGMAFSLLYQVLDGRLGLCRKLCQVQPPVRHKRSHSDWGLDELTEALVWALEASTEAFCVFLDGLDEAKELEHLPWPEWTNAQVIHKLLKVNDLKLCASSREEHAFCSFFEGSFRLRIHHLNSCDITLFVRERLDICGLECPDRNELVHEIVKKAEGVFLWVALVVDRLNRAIRQGYTSIEMLQERLKQTPSDLTTLYTDMWSRIGDEARLRSIQVTASLYFNLVMVARKMQYHLSKGSYSWGLTTVGMSSLLIMATATQNKSIETILSTGRVMAVDDLLARCTKAENELRLACRGLLEVTRKNQELPCRWNGDERLCDYNLTKVDFIHRSAFDFLMDTGPGRECLHACGSSENELASRLVAAHLIRARFIHLKRGLHYRLMDFHQLSSYQAIFCDTYLQMAIAISYNTQLFEEGTVRDGLLDVLEEWQSSGLFGGHVYWFMPACSRSNSNHLKLEFIEASISVAVFNRRFWHRVVEVKSLLDKYPAPLFIDAVPIILRALSIFDWHDQFSDYLLEILKYILRRLRCIATEDAQRQDAVKDSTRTLHSWYIVYCLAASSSSDCLGSPDGFLDVELLAELRDTLLLEEDWHHLVLLEYQADNEYAKSFKLFQNPESFPENGHYALVAGNFATAYRLLDELLLRHFLRTLKIDIPRSLSCRFDVILLADVYSLNMDAKLLSVNCYTPETRFHNQIEHLLWQGG
ncbi:hypothetical protein FOVSG1_013683 [Fusarium oxysporum f. sp. vasinfectum]